MSISVLKLGNLVATVAGAAGTVFDQNNLAQPAAKLSLQYLGAIDSLTRPSDDFWGTATPASLVWVASVDGVFSPPFFRLDILLFWVQTYLNHRKAVWEDIKRCP
jgi:hypothetical protein